MISAEVAVARVAVDLFQYQFPEDGFVVTVHGKGSFVAETDTGLAEEARRRDAEEKLAQAVDSVRSAGLTDEEIRALLEIIQEG